MNSKFHLQYERKLRKTPKCLNKCWNFFFIKTLTEQLLCYEIIVHICMMTRQDTTCFCEIGKIMKNSSFSIFMIAQSPNHWMYMVLRICLSYQRSHSSAPYFHILCYFLSIRLCRKSVFLFHLRQVFCSLSSKTSTLWTNGMNNLKVDARTNLYRNDFYAT